jgi:hypothetical protein
MERVRCLGTHEGIRLDNGHVSLVATVDIGARIVEYARDGGMNVLGEARDASIETEYGVWRAYGGHRLWIAPEINPRSYVPDNEPVEVEELGETGVRLVSPIAQQIGIQKALTILLDSEGSGVSVLHRLTNHGPWTVELAPWALTIVGAGGEALVPQEPYRPHAESLLPVRTMALWSYTDLGDTRLHLGRRFIRVRSDTAMTEPFKIGLANAQRWAAWHRDGTLFLKRFPYAHDALYPDMGSNTEIYTAGDFMELESLGPMIRLDPGASVEHLERWHLYDGMTLSTDDDELESALLPVLLQAGLENG